MPEIEIFDFKYSNLNPLLSKNRHKDVLYEWFMGLSAVLSNHRTNKPKIKS